MDWHRDPRSVAGSGEHAAQGAGAGQATDRGEVAHEHRPVPYLGPAVAQVIHQRRSDLRGKRQAVPASALAGHHDLPSPPVDVLQTQAHHLPAAQAEPAQQHQDRIVPAPDRAAAITGTQQCAHRGRADSSRRRGVPSRHREHRVIQSQLRQTLQAHIAHQAAQGRDDLAGRGHPPAPANPGRKTRDVHRTQTSPVDPIPTPPLGDKQPGHVHIEPSRPLDQPSFHPQIAAIALQEHRHRIGENQPR